MIYQHGQAECRSAPFPARDLEISSHRFRKTLDKRNTKSGSAVASGNFRAPLREWTEYLFQFARAHSNSTISEREHQPHTLARRGFGIGGEQHTPGIGEFHRIVGEIFQRGAETQDIPLSHSGKIDCDLHVGGKRLVACARLKCGTDGFSQHARREQLIAKHESANVCFGPINDQSGERSQMIGAALDRVSPFAFARAQIGRGQQFRQSHNAGKRCANVVRDTGERGLNRSRLRDLCAHEMMVHAFAWQIWPWPSV